jgi:hypothetical protein
MTRYEKRLTALARDLRLCPVHGERPVCVVRCDLIWAGTTAEEEELYDLIDRAWLGVYIAPPRLPCWVCGHEGAVCLSCLNAELAQWPRLTDTPLSADERTRYDTLMQHVRPHPRYGGSPDAV